MLLSEVIMCNIEIIQASINYIESNLYTAINPSELCDKYNISEFHFHQLTYLKTLFHLLIWAANAFSKPSIIAHLLQSETHKL